MAFAERERKVVYVGGHGYVRLIAYYDPLKVTESELLLIESLFSSMEGFEKAQRRDAADEAKP